MPRSNNPHVEGSQSSRARDAIARQEAKAHQAGYGGAGVSPDVKDKAKAKELEAQARGLRVDQLEDDDWKPRPWGAKGGSIIDHLPARPALDGPGWQPVPEMPGQWRHPVSGWYYHQPSNMWWHAGAPDWADWDARAARALERENRAKERNIHRDR